MSNRTTQFKKGFDPRRGSNKGIMEYRQGLSKLFAEFSQDAAEYVYSVMSDSSKHPKLRLIAAKEILDRGIGKAVDRRTLALETDQGSDLQTITDEQLQALIATLSGASSPHLDTAKKKPKIINKLEDKT